MTFRGHSKKYSKIRINKTRLLPLQTEPIKPWAFVWGFLFARLSWALYPAHFAILGFFNCRCPGRSAVAHSSAGRILGNKCSPYQTLGFSDCGSNTGYVGLHIQSIVFNILGFIYSPSRAPPGSTKTIDQLEYWAIYMFHILYISLVFWFYIQPIIYILDYIFRPSYFKILGYIYRPFLLWVSVAEENAQNGFWATYAVHCPLPQSEGSTGQNRRSPQVVMRLVATEA